jgi:hypothetical protein
MVSACSALPASKPQSSGSPSPTEEGQATTEFHPAGLEETPMGTPPAGPIDDGYPVPDEILPTLEPLSKALAPGSSSFSMYLPGIWNERIPSYPFELQTTGVMAVQGFFGCNWIGVAGQVFDLSGAPLPNLVLHLEGTWAPTNRPPGKALRECDSIWAGRLRIYPGQPDCEQHPGIVDPNP